MAERTTTETLGWREVALLSAIAAGASRADVDRIFGAAPARESIGELERRGLVDGLAPATVTCSKPGGSPDESSPRRRGRPACDLSLTPVGREAVLTHVAAWAGSADKLEEERRHVERLRTDLLSTISHELRTPLTLIRTSIGLLLDSEPDEQMGRRLLRNIKQSTDRMNLLVTDLLDLARLGSDRFELQMRRIDLGKLVHGAVSLLRPLLDAKEQTVDITLPPSPAYVPGDYRRLERVLLNLLGNANKFAGDGTRIAIVVSEESDVFRVTVRDRGPGIPQSAMPRLFDQFFTARTSSTRYNIGAGLGLPIAKGIVEAHGGRIWAESEVGTGTAVSFTLPRRWPREGDDENPGG